MVALFVMICVSSQQAKSDIQGDFVRLPPDQRVWVEQSCSKSLGPSLYFNCVTREVNALQSGVPDLSRFSVNIRDWINQSCSRSLGPSLYINCVKRETVALLAQPPDLSHLSEEQKAWIQQTCSTTLGPNLYFNCVRREVAAFGLSPPPPRVTAPPFNPGPTNPPPITAARPPAPAPSQGWPRWAGARPIMPKSVSTATLSPAEIFRNAGVSVYVVIAGASLQAISGDGDDVAQGSAVAISDHEVITNCHIFNGRPVAALVQGEVYRNLSILRADVEGDRCILRSPELTLQPVRGIRPYEELAVGERAYSIGAPSGLEKTLGEGLISGLRSHDGLRLIQTSAPISSGSSGGALFDDRGNLIGITTFLLRNSQNLNFAIAASDFWR